MECTEVRVDTRVKPTAEEAEKNSKIQNLVYRFNMTQSRTPESEAILKELFGENRGEGGTFAAPLYGAAFDRLKIGKNVFINSNLLAMARGGITIEDNVMIAANVQLISNNHDLYDLPVITCKPVLIKEGAWIGAGATVLPGVCVGKHAVVGACSVVTKDVPDYAVVVGSPAKVIRMLDPERFQDK